MPARYQGSEYVVIWAIKISIERYFSKLPKYAPCPILWTSKTEVHVPVTVTIDEATRRMTHDRHSADSSMDRSDITTLQVERMVGIYEAFIHHEAETCCSCLC